MIIILVSIAQEELKNLGENVGICFSYKNFTKNKKVSLNSIYYIFFGVSDSYVLWSHIAPFLEGNLGLEEY